MSLNLNSSTYIHKGFININIILRSGRLSRPPRYMVKDFKKLTEDSEASYSDYRSDSEENSENSPFLHLPRKLQCWLTHK